MSAVTPESHSDAQASVPPPPVVPEAKPQKLIVTLAGSGTLAGLLIVVAYHLTQPTIQANKERALAAAVNDVLKSPARYDTYYVAGDQLVTTPPAGDAERVFLGRDENGAPKGFALVAAGAGFQDMIRVIFGYDPKGEKVLGMKVLENKETPGLGDKIEKSAAFVGQFVGAQTPLVGVKPGQGRDDDPHQIDTITGATISSRAVVRTINTAVERLKPALSQMPAESP